MLVFHSFKTPTMRTKLNLKLYHLLSSLFLISTIFSCGSYQGVSYYASDGIYGGNASVGTRTEKSNKDNKEVYYKEYFNNIADDYSSLENPQKYVDIDSDNYIDNNVRGNSDVRVNSQAPWGDRTSKTEVYYINNNPWGYFNNNWGFYNSFFDPFWNYNPFFNRGFYRPFWGLSFYDPFYRFGYFGYYGYPNFGYPYRYGYRGYYGNLYDRSYAQSPYSRGSGRYANANNSMGGRYSENFSRTRSARSNRYSRVNTNSASSTKRYNEGRRPPSKTSNSNSSQTSRSNNTRSNNNSRYNNRTQSNSNYSSTNRSNYNSGRSFSSSRSYSSGGRSSNYSSGSRGYISGGRSSSRGR